MCETEGKKYKNNYNNIKLTDEIIKKYDKKLDSDRLRYLFDIMSKYDCNVKLDKSVFGTKDKQPILFMDLKCYEDEKFYDRLRFEPQDIEPEFLIILMIKYLLEHSHYNNYWTRKKISNPNIDKDYVTVIARSTTFGYELLTNPEKNLKNDIRYGILLINVKRSNSINFLLENLEENFNKDELSSYQIISDNLFLVSNIINYNLEYKFIHHKYRDSDDNIIVDN